jgi:homoserine kinase
LTAAALQLMTGEGVRITVPATSANLGPGFDVVGLALGLHNVVEVRRAEAGVRVSVEGQGAGELPEDRSNLVVRAMEEVFSRTGPPGGGVEVRLINAIPLSRGLGSSAAAVVGGLMAARALSGWDADESALLQLATALEGHGDNAAAALLGGLVLAVPYEGAVLARGFALPPGLVAVLFIPESRLSTEDARRALPESVTRHDAVLNIGRTALLLTALAGGEFELLGAAMRDEIHQRHRASLVPGLQEVIDAAVAAGAHGAALSGAGPSVIALAAIDADVDAVARAMSQTAAAHSVQGRTQVLEPGVEGARVEPL